MTFLQNLKIGVILLFCSNVMGQITVDFTASQTEGCGFAQVEFCDNSTSQDGSIVGWSWNIGGITSTGECQGRLFNSPGSYDICLTVTDSDGNSETLCHEDFIIIHSLPIPDFEGNPTVGCVPLTSTFTYTGTPNIKEYFWGLGGTTGVFTSDGSASPDAISTYTIADEYSISLTVKDSNNCVNFINKTDYIKSYGTTQVIFSTPDTFACEAPHIVNFNNENITSEMQYSWNFGNGETYFGSTPPAITYEEEGSYSVTVVGYNNVTFCRDTLILENYITVGFPVLFAFSPFEGCEDFDASFIDISGFPADSVFWNFGDNTPLITEENPCHLFEEPGSYVVSLTRYVQGCVNTKYASFPIHVFPQSDIEMSSSDTIGCSLPHPANFEGISDDATIISWHWDFGDGTTSDLQSPSHLYESYGVFPVVLTVINTNGCETRISDITVKVKELEASIPEDEILGCVPLEINIVDNSYSINPIISREWQLNLPSGSLISNESIANFTIPDTGCFDLILTVTNSLGCVDIDTFENKVCAGSEPEIAFVGMPTSICVGEIVSFTDLSSENVNEWYWHFGNGTASDEQNPSATFEQVGFYSIYLEVGHNGCLVDTLVSSYIQVQFPKSNFNIIQDCNNLSLVELENISSGADSSFWDFGVVGISTDTSSLFEPIFQYPDTGVYTITLTTFNTATGCEHILEKTVFVQEVNSAFFVSQTQGCYPMTITASCPSQAVNYEWSGTGMNFSNPNSATTEIDFDQAGFYNDLKLVTENSNGCKDSTIFLDTIFVNEIQANYSANYIGDCDLLDITFSDSTTNLFTENISWNWFFEDSLSSGQGEQIVHVFSGPGIHNVALHVEDNWGCKSSITQAVEIINVESLFEVDSLGCTVSAFTFENLSTGKDVEYLWDFGDGETSNLKNPTHQYLDQGIFSPCLLVTDIYGCSDTFCIENGIEIINPSVSFIMDNAFQPCPPMFVNFENTSSNVLFYQWDFGDGSGYSNIKNPTHIYPTPGVYDVTLIAYSSANCVDTFVMEQAIELNGPEGNFYFEVDTSCVPLDVTFYTENINAISLTWDFGDGSALDSTVVFDSTGAYTYTYNSVGNFVPKLAISDGIGCVRIIEKPDTIIVTDLNIDVIATDNLLCSNQDSVLFLAETNPMEFIDDYQWTMNGGVPNNSTFENPSTHYPVDGAYDVSLIVSNDFCSDTIMKNNFIIVGKPPEANFITSAISGCEPLSIDFTDQSIVENSIITEWNWDFGDSTISSLSNPSHTFQAGNYLVALEVISDIGCIDTIVQEIIVNPLPEIEVVGNDINCLGDSTQLLATILGDASNFNFYWENSPSLSCTDCLNPIATPLENTIYTFVAYSDFGCETIFEIEIETGLFEIPTISLNNDTIICINEQVQLLADAGSNIATYQWNNIPGLSCYDCPNPIATPLIPSTYQVTVTSTDGCTNSATVHVNVLNQNQSFASEDRVICLGDSIQLSANLGNDPTWLNPSFLSCSECFTPMASPEENTEYIVEVTTLDGCIIFDSIMVWVISPEEVSAGDDLTICLGNSTTLQGELFNDVPDGYQSYSWTPTLNVNHSDSIVTIVGPLENTMYVLTANIDACIMTDSVLVNVITDFQVEGVGVEGCFGDTVQLNAIGYADSYEWYPSIGLSDPFISNPTLVINETTNYTLTAELELCPPEVSEAEVTMLTTPEVFIPSYYPLLLGQPVQLNIENNNFDYSYSWQSKEGLSCDDCPDPIYSIYESINLFATVTDIFNGCDTTLMTRLELVNNCPDALISVPNAFTPNGDGVNDQLEIYYNPTLFLEDYNFQIYGRWGNVIFETQDINEFWDGTYKGTILNEGVYIFMLQYKCPLTGKMITDSGDITIHY
ncbi:MAG: PKD domain-containing protein [Saprospiraceae bacterium]